MPRDPGLEALIHEALGTTAGLTEKGMFGGWVFLLHGKILCGARPGVLLVRVGRDNEAWALAIPGVVPAVMGSRRMAGYVRATSEAYADDGIRQRLIDAAVAFTRSLPR